MTKVCSMCPVPLPLSEFYKRGDCDKLSNVCKACTRAAVTRRHRERKAGTFVNSHVVVVKELTGKLKGCNDCTAVKDEAHFRPYITKVKGKDYHYRANRCRECEAGKEQSKRWSKTLFNEDEYTSITDSYNL